MLLLLQRHPHRMSLSVDSKCSLLQFHKNVTCLRNSIIPIFRFIALQDEGCNDHIVVIQIDTMKCILLLLKFYHQSIGHEGLSNHLWRNFHEWFHNVVDPRQKKKFTFKFPWAFLAVCLQINNISVNKKQCTSI